MSKTVMVVDDEPDILNTIKTVLQKQGYNVITAVNGDDCLRKLRTEKPDLILMDIMMPGTPVRDIVPKIKDIKIAYMTAVRISEAEKEELFKNKNIIGYIQKPFDIDKMLNQVKKMLPK